ncbi:uncharacterized protein MELLADRAFT_110232 [Melampsora larici-populina 98AG31]|uniref:Secreted protein n=1 Tax=Melampsora larici-populina (strain 98AG31 / pathotype 3-4-7) TaxID=747676 RepID=F4RZ39_MELLP|nr:uncharacterized protein MELLADRAFT_110232 [Melampsora larici-populina 98AG31]EGG02348.1 secreted protein [Melampsora larici-populina 98AG31]
MFKAIKPFLVLMTFLVLIIAYTLAHKHKPIGLEVTCESSWNTTQLNTTSAYTCSDRGVNYNCTICHGTLLGKDCYKKLGEDHFDINPSGDIQCTKSYNRTAYEEGGGLTICIDNSNTVYQCSHNEKPTVCESCERVGVTSNP